ncbi:MAG TPA: phage holin family protein [Acidimicrobiales bacterium]
MPGRSDKKAKDGGRRRTTAEGRQFVDLVVAYAKQETLGPLRGLGRFLGFGVGGSVLLAVGLPLLLLALLRALQTETGSTFGGNLSWLPYLITAVAALAVAGLAVWRITKTLPDRAPAPSSAKDKR